MAGFGLNNDPSDLTLRVKDGAPLVGRNSRPSQFRLDRPISADRSAIAEGGFQPVSLPGKKRRLIWRPSTPVDERLAEVVPFSMGREIRRGAPGPHPVVSSRPRLDQPALDRSSLFDGEEPPRLHLRGRNRLCGAVTSNPAPR